MIHSAAQIIREYGPFPGAAHVHGVSFDGRQVWFASGDRLNAFDPATGRYTLTVLTLLRAAIAGFAIAAALFAWRYLRRPRAP